MTPHDLTRSSGLPLSPDGGPVFAEPWQASAFAMAVHLHQCGVFSWSEWAEALSRELHKPGRAVDGSDYFDSWVLALSGLLAQRAIAPAEIVDEMTRDWQRAAEATPHGQPILLTNR